MSPAVPPTDAQWMDGSYVWHPFAEVLMDPTIQDPATYEPTMELAGGYVNADTFVSGPPRDITLTWGLPFQGMGPAALLFPLQLHHAVVTISLSVDHAIGTRGVISGILDPNELITSFEQVAVALDDAFCSSATVVALVDELASTCDIGLDGTQDPTKTCDGISIGLGFTAKAAKLGAPSAPLVPADGCAGSTGG
jgi:hypothetical protein